VRGAISNDRPYRDLVVTVLCGLLLVTEQQIAVPQAEQPQRPTSTPYTGDLSIFEKPGRDERLQIQRVMNLLGNQGRLIGRRYWCRIWVVFGPGRGAGWGKRNSVCPGHQPGCCEIHRG
jgi:hypothetical protein